LDEKDLTSGLMNLPDFTGIKFKGRLESRIGFVIASKVAQILRHMEILLWPQRVKLRIPEDGDQRFRAIVIAIPG
jgi:hypothetical protein